MSNLSFGAQLGLNAATAGINSLLEIPFASWNDSRSRSLARYQTELQKELFDYQSSYNTPANQVKRLLAAGLNPNLVYGNGADATSSMPGAPSAALQPASAPRMENFADLFERTRLGNAQLGFRDSAELLNRQKSISETIKQYRLNQEAARTDIQSRYWADQAAAMQKNLELTNDLQSMQIWHEYLKAHLTQRETLRIDKVLDLTDKQIQYMSGKIRMQPAEFANLIADFRSAWLSGNESVSRQRLQDIEYKIKKKGFDIWESTGINPNDSSGPVTKLFNAIASWIDGLSGGSRSGASKRRSDGLSAESTPMSLF